MIESARISALLLFFIVAGCVHVDLSESQNLDLDIDSDNSNAFALPDRSNKEETLEENTGVPGRIIIRNDDDFDGDQIPGFADGFNLDGIANTPDDESPRTRFASMVLEIGGDIDVQTAVLNVAYQASDPAQTSLDGRGRYAPAAGHLRIWTKPADQSRIKSALSNGGDFLAPASYSAVNLGLNSNTRKRTLYVEGITQSTNLADQLIEISLGQGDSMATANNGDAVRLTVADLQFITRGKGERHIQQEFTYNAVPAPQITTTTDDCRITEDGNIALQIQGSVFDPVSSMVSDSAFHLREISITPENGESIVLDLSNRARPTLPWEPFRFEASFETEVQFQPGYEYDEYRIVLETPENLAGVPGHSEIAVVHSGSDVQCESVSISEPDRFMPTIIRVGAPEGTFDHDNDGIKVFGQTWPLRAHELGDGKFFYAMGEGDSPQVFVAALYADDSASRHGISMVDAGILATLTKNNADLSFHELYAIFGLAVEKDSVNADLGKLNNYTEQVFHWESEDVYVYRPRSGWAGHTDSTLDTEIKWRYVNHADTISEFFKSRQQFLAHVNVRKKIVSAAKAPKSWGISAWRFNANFWTTDIKVKTGKTASAAINNMFVDPSDYDMGCLMAALFVIEQGIAKGISGAALDNNVLNMPLHLRGKVLSNEYVPVAGSSLSGGVKWIPGDWGYIDNPDPAHDTGGFLQGENIIYTGGNWELDYNKFSSAAMFWGHPAGEKTLAGWIKEVDLWSSAYKAKLLDLRTRVRY